MLLHLKNRYVRRILINNQSKENLNVNFNKTVTTIKPLHGVNNGPVTRINQWDTSKYFKEAGIPFARLHDTEYPYGSGHYVDIPCVFPNFDADPNDPASYDFHHTDSYIKAIEQTGTKTFYRLGASIEHAEKKYNIFPPTNYEKWAKICVGIIKHYNEGWADGHHFGIEYWEIWNEPENPPMWMGTKEQYFKLYDVASKYIKANVPNAKVGGYAGCGFYAIDDPNADDFYKGFVTYFTDFIQYVIDNNDPFDFFSWHIYSLSIEQAMLHATYVRKTLDEYGFTKVESILDEWNLNPVPQNGDDSFITRFKPMKSMPGAAFTAGMFCAMQKSSIDKAMYYDAQPMMSYCGIFDEFASPHKAYYSFKAFNELYKLGTEVESLCNIQNLYCAAAKNGKDGAILISNYNGRTQSFHIEIDGFRVGQSTRVDIYVLDDTHEFTLTKTQIFNNELTPLQITMHKNTVVLLRLINL